MQIFRTPVRPQSTIANLTTALPAVVSVASSQDFFFRELPEADDPTYMWLMPSQPFLFSILLMAHSPRDSATPPFPLERESSDDFMGDPRDTHLLLQSLIKEHYRPSRERTHHLEIG
jgi:hypothetical protein